MNVYTTYIMNTTYEVPCPRCGFEFEVDAAVIDGFEEFGETLCPDCTKELYCLELADALD